MPVPLIMLTHLAPSTRLQFRMSKLNVMRALNVSILFGVWALHLYASQFVGLIMNTLNNTRTFHGTVTLIRKFSNTCRGVPFKVIYGPIRSHYIHS